MKVLLQRCNVVNSNGRIYPREVLEEAVNNPEFKERLKNGQVIGTIGMDELGRVNMTRVSHVIKDIFFIGNDMFGDVEILPTPEGKKLRDILSESNKPEIALQGVGDTDYRDGHINVVKNLSITGFSFVNKSSNSIDNRADIFDMMGKGILNIGDEVMTEYGIGKVTHLFARRGSGYGVILDINGIEYVFERKFE